MVDAAGAVTAGAPGTAPFRRASRPPLKRPTTRAIFYLRAIPLRICSLLPLLFSTFCELESSDGASDSSDPQKAGGGGRPFACGSAAAASAAAPIICIRAGGLRPPSPAPASAPAIRPHGRQDNHGPWMVCCGGLSPVASQLARALGCPNGSRSPSPLL